MNTKTNHEYASNSYNGGIMGSDSPAALLDMLAEVASQTLHSEKKRNKSLVPSQCKSRTDHVKRKSHESCFTVPQLLSMPASQLVKQFSIFTSDELKRQYSYTCALVVGCGQKYTSFASEGRARVSIKAHLAEHLEYLKTNKETYKTFTAKSVSYKGYKSSPQNKKGRLQQLRKPQETLNKENKNVSPEKPTNYLRNILLNDSTFKELDKNKNVENADNAKKLHSSDQKDTDRIDFKVLGDHSYFERLKDEVPLKKEASSFSDSPENTADENIVLMVVGTDSVHMKEYPRIKKLSEKIHENFEAIYLPEIAWSAESEDKNVEIATTKPKGKAKFIGTSKEEREMALAFMDRIKKKGNPTGSNLECRICNPPRSFTAPTTLVSHYRSHAGIKPYECRICRAVFTRRHSLKYHMLIHQNQTRFTCADCGKKFRHPSHFREHRRRHTGEAPFGCDDCGQRFKTRNTYKRHLKTRHGKVLTTTGELLYLSEEDFEKVRTNRKKKNDTNSREQHGLDEDVRAAKAIMRYENNDEEEQQEGAALTEEYIINDDTTGSDKNWESNDAIEIMKDCFEAYEVCPESHLNKTESIETEIPMETRYCTSDENSLPNEYADKVQDKSPHSPSASYINLEAVKDDSDEIVCHGSAGQREIIYRDVNQPPSYIKVQYSSLVNGMEDGDALQFQGDLELSEQQIIEQTEEHYLDADCNDSNGGQPRTNSMQASSRIEAIGDRHAILAEEDAKYEEQGSDTTALHCSSFQQMKAHDEIGVPGELMNLNTLREANGANGANGNIADEDTLTRQNEDCALQDEKEEAGVGNYQTVVTNLINSEIIAPSNYAAEQGKKSVNQADGLRICCNEPVTSIIVQNKCFNILPQMKSKILLNKSQNFTLLNKHMQAINIKQNGNQNTILLLTNDALQSSVFDKRDRKESADDDDEMEKQ